MVLKKIMLIILGIFLMASISSGQSTSDSTALIVGENGNVGIGTETPETMLQIKTNGGNTPGLSIKNDCTANGSFPYSFYLVSAEFIILT